MSNFILRQFSTKPPSETFVKSFVTLCSQKLANTQQTIVTLYKKLYQAQRDYFTDRDIKLALDENQKHYRELKDINEELKKAELVLAELEKDMSLTNAKIKSVEADINKLHHEKANPDELVKLEQEAHKLRIHLITSLSKQYENAQNEVKKLQIKEREKTSEWTTSKNHLNEILVITNTRGNIMRFWLQPFWNILLLLVTAVIGYIFGRLGLKRYVPVPESQLKRELLDLIRKTENKLEQVEQSIGTYQANVGEFISEFKKTRDEEEKKPIALPTAEKEKEYLIKPFYLVFAAAITAQCILYVGYYLVSSILKKFLL